ncbi:MAG TPA: TonB-dependent receptor [Chthoniobacterales bacterium]|nr:TonB-dependent receptor [Chthoniobacterales bacterium]
MARRRLVWAAFLAVAVTAPAHDQEAVLDRVVVEADRLPNAESGAPFSIHLVDENELRRAPQLRLDDILRAQVPGFSLFRRNSSRTANPTTQGVTLRNFGPSGAGRTLVLLDGIPVNDPFAGYVLWSQVPPAAIKSVLVNSGGGAGLFGNAALAGTIFLVTKSMDATSGFAEGLIGNAETYEASLEGMIVRGRFAAAIFAERFSIGGYPVIAPDQRGRVDTDASADSNLFDLRAEWQLAPNSSLRLQGRRFEDERGNGTLFTRNETVGSDISAVFAQKFPAQRAELRLSAYGQSRRFSSTFSSVNATRDVETPALDQFDVPANAAGGAIVWSAAAGGDHRLTLGADARWVEGETNEAFLWNGTEFTRLRQAGGEQFFAGIFAEDTWSVSPSTTIVGGLRVDHWELFDGLRQETVRATGTVLTDSRFVDRDGNEINGRIGARVRPTKALALRGAVYTGFRVPTLNELYRPFRVGNDVTNANPELKPEHLIGGEIAAEWQAAPTFRLAGTAFLNRMEDAVSNVTIGPGPGGGVIRQRQNVDLVTAPGFEATAEWQLVSSVRLKGSYLFTHPTIERTADPALTGNLLAQTPENVFTGGIEWTPTAKWVVNAQLRYSDRQFEDDQNSRVLAPFTTVDAALIYQFSQRGSAAIRIENLFDTEIETGRSADGLLSIGTPRLVTLQVRWQL